jgi:hypothetical protein
MVGEAEHPHAEPAELDVEVRAGGQFADHPVPHGEDLTALACVGDEADRPADMVERDLGLGNGAGQIDQLAEFAPAAPSAVGDQNRLQNYAKRRAAFHVENQGKRIRFAA